MQSPMPRFVMLPCAAASIKKGTLQRTHTQRNIGLTGTICRCAKCTACFGHPSIVDCLGPDLQRSHPKIQGLQLSLEIDGCLVFGNQISLLNVDFTQSRRDHFINKTDPHPSLYKYMNQNPIARQGTAKRRRPCSHHRSLK